MSRRPATHYDVGRMTGRPATIVERDQAGP
jgi:hypothetical protein